MAEYIVNQVGSVTMDFPTLNVGDTYLLNTTTLAQSGKVHTFTLPSGEYEIEIAGACGSEGANGVKKIGLGVILKFVTTIKESSQVSCLVASRGSKSPEGSSNGGGGTYLEFGKELIAVAGGGGGYGGSYGGCDAVTDTISESMFGIPSPNECDGGYTGYLNPHGGGGGGGYINNGGVKASNSGYGGLSYKNGGTGASSRDSKSYGGYGGGGGCHESTGGGGGGGGYTGGNGGAYYSSQYYGGVGGSSYINSTYITKIISTSDGKYKKSTTYNNETIHTSSFNDGQGYCRITLIKQYSPINIKCNIDGQFKDTELMSAKIDNTWREVEGVFVKVGNEWKSNE